MEIQGCSLPGFYCSRILGLAPYLIRRNRKNRIDEIRRSPWLCLYSICFMTATVSLTVRFIFIDASSKQEIRKKTGTSRFVAAIDVSVIVGVCICGAITGMLGYNNIQQINSNLSRIDDELAMFNEPKKDKKHNIILVATVFLIMTGMLILDAIAKWGTSKSFKESQLQSNLAKKQIDSSLAFYVLYYILIALHTQLAQTALGIQRRYLRLNSAIRYIFSLEKLLGIRDHLKINKMDVQKIREPMTIDTNDETFSTGRNADTSHATQDGNRVMPIFDSNKYLASVSTTAFGKLTKTRITLSGTDIFLYRLSYTHAILRETVTVISKTFGMTILVLLASCLFHLVATTYFLFIGILSDPDWFVASLQLLWICFHGSRLLLIVEPCHMATVEANRTIVIVCEALRNCRDSAIEPFLKRFWQQLVADRTYYFMASGLCTIDRQILTSISSAVTTYLVILIQFQRSDA